MGGGGLARGRGVWGGGGGETQPPTHPELAQGESLHCALLLDYVPPEEPPSKPLGNALRIR